ncbi:MAG: hypothetical protein ABIH01_00320 [Candidatus Omnitrophota bacterium]
MRYCLAVLICLCTVSALAEGYNQVPAVVDVESYIGNGQYMFDEIAELARKYGVKVVFMADEAFVKAEYGLFPLRGLLKITKERNSVIKFGAAKYLKLIEKTNRENPDIIIIPGLEVVPFYFWTGSPFKGDLTLNNFHKELLVFGLERAGDIKGLLRCMKWSHYSGDLGSAPYQKAIDYVNSKNGFAIWAAPEAKTEGEMKGTRYITLPYSGELLRTRGYKGFGYFHEGYRDVGSAGGIWDRVLVEYCEGKRAHPAWALGQADYHYEGEAQKIFGELLTVLLIEGRPTKEKALNALKNGNMYVTLGAKEKLFLDEFTVSGNGKNAVMGEEISLEGGAQVSIKITSSANNDNLLKIKIIRMGEVIKVYEEKTPFSAIYEDDYYKPGERIYYRIDAGNMVSNPIFVKFINTSKENNTDGHR